MATNADYPVKWRRRGTHGLERLSLGRNADTIHKITNLSTDDGTATLIDTIDVAEGEAVSVVVRALGREPGGSGDHYSGSVEGTFYRETSGNVTELGADAAIYTAKNTDSWGGVTLVANTSTQTVDIKVDGKAATDVNWVVLTEGMRVRD